MSEINSQDTLNVIKHIPGWLSEAESRLLIRTFTAASQRFPTCSAVEIGSFCGRSTVLLGKTLKALSSEVRLYAIDPHKGLLSGTRGAYYKADDTFAEFTRNLAVSGVSDVISVMRCHSFEVIWQEPIGFLFIDALHEYEHVSIDFRHFEPWLLQDAHVVFHDYGGEFPGVTRLVDELVESGECTTIERVDSAIVLKVERHRPYVSVGSAFLHC